MATHTIAQRLAASLLARGAVELKATAKYRAFRLPHPQYPERTYYVGKAGALRLSYTGKVSSTRNCSDRVRGVLLG